MLSNINDEPWWAHHDNGGKHYNKQISGGGKNGLQYDKWRQTLLEKTSVSANGGSGTVPCCKI